MSPRCRARSRLGVAGMPSPCWCPAARRPTPEQVRRLTEAFLPMKKFDLATLQVAYRGG